MLIQGSFINQQGETISLYILTKEDRSTSIEIGDEEAGLFFSDDPIEIKSSVNDTFDVLLPQSATIHLLSRDYQPDFFCASCREAVVNIYRDGECLFAGFIEPMAYSQDYNETLDEISLSCIDALSALQYSNYKEIGSADVDYDTVKKKADQRTFLDIIKEVIQGVGASLDILNGNSPSIYYDGSRSIDDTEANKYTIFENIALSELVFLGDEEDDTWTQEDVLSEILRYFNLHIAQEGLSFRIFAWETVKSSDEVVWQEISDTTITDTTTPQTIDITSHIAADCNTQISVDEVFNQLQLTCDMQSVENIIDSPLDDDLLTPVFDTYQKYLTEYSREDPGPNCYEAFEKMIFGDTTRVNAKGYITDWFIWIMRNSLWRIPTKGESGDYYHTYFTVKQNQQSLLNFLALDGRGAILMAWAKDEKTEEDRTKDNSPTASLSWTNYLVIPVSGNGDDTEDGTWPNATSLLSRCPRAIYEGAVSGGVLSPSDDSTTNYIVLSGKILLAPLLDQTNNYTYLHDTFTWPAYYTYDKYGNVTGSVIGDDFKIAEFDGGEDGERFYTQQYFKATKPTDTAEWDKSTTKGLMPPIEDGKKLYKFKYSAIGDDGDNISKVSVLACMLIVGDKCVVETGTQGQPSDFSWQTYKELSECADEDEYYQQCFYIGFDPKIDDYLIGNSFDFQNNIKYTMGIDAEGIAIPIKKSDGISGAVQFKILGPVNVTWDEITKRHKTWFRHTKWSTTSKPLMAHVSNIYLDSFEMKIYSDNGLMGDIGDNDLIYMSDTDETYINKKDDLTFKIASALTTEERTALGVSDSIALNTPTDMNTNTAVLSIYDAYQKVSAKPEQLYVDAYYQEYHTPHVLMKQSIIESRAAASRFNHYRHPAIGKTFFVQGIDRNLTEGSATLNLKEL